MDNFWKKYKNFLILAALLAFFGGISFLGIERLIEEIKTNDESIKKEIIGREEREKRLAEAPKLKNQFEIAEREGDKFKVILSRNQIVAIIEKLEEIAAETGNEMAIEDMEIKNEESEKKAKEKSGEKSGKNEKKLLADIAGSYISMAIKLRGSYNSALNFIEKIEKMDCCADIISIQMLTEESDAVNQASGTLLSADPFAKRRAAPKSEVAAKKETGETIINSALGAVVYFSE